MPDRAAIVWEIFDGLETPMETKTEEKKICEIRVIRNCDQHNAHREGGKCVRRHRN